eukprot:RCo039014
MGSKPVRERHHCIYGSTLSSLGKADQWGTLKSNGSATTAEARQRQQQYMTQLSQQQHSSFGSEDKGLQSHSMRNRAMADKSEMDTLFGPLNWLYASMQISKEELEDEGEEKKIPVANLRVFKKAVRVVDRVLKQAGIEPSDELKRREQRRVTDRSQHGLLFDMITTRRVILTGEPHRVGVELYRYVARRYHAVKFTFIGITDNGSKRVARDVFCKDKVAEADGAFDNYIMKCDFEVVDENHMYVIYPEDENVATEIAAMGIQRRKEEEEARRSRYYTPKFVPEPLPECIAKAVERQRREALEKLAERPPVLRCSCCSSSASPHQRSPTAASPDPAPSASLS